MSLSLPQALRLLSVLSDEGYFATWSRNGNRVRIISEAPRAVILSALACVGGGL